MLNQEMSSTKPTTAFCLLLLCVLHVLCGAPQQWGGIPPSAGSSCSDSGSVVSSATRQASRG
eukprot:COSAG01_NODE_58151_length_307_cov_8.437500_1_plen_61_part_10